MEVDAIVNTANDHPTVGQAVIMRYIKLRDMNSFWNAGKRLVM